MKLILTFFTALACTYGYAQSATTSLPPFERIVASQFIHVILEKGDAPSIRLEYHGVDPEQVNVKVKRKKLQLYLDDAKLVSRPEKYYYNGQKHTRDRYNNVSVTAYVTYTTLRGLEIRGEEDLVCNGAIQADKFKLKVYGASHVTLASLQTKRFKASVYGSNQIHIRAGNATHQLYRLFGENKIDTEHLSSHTTASRIYGEGRLTVSAQDELKIIAFGEPEIRLSGPAQINKNIILGEADIKVKRP